MLAELRKLYPRNRLVVLEAGSTALRAGGPRTAEALLTGGLNMLRKGQRARIPAKEALWRYKRGAARLALNQVAPARRRLTAAVGPELRPGSAGARIRNWPRLAMKTRRFRGRARAMRSAPKRCASRATIRRASPRLGVSPGVAVAVKVRTWVWIVVAIAVGLRAGTRRDCGRRLLLRDAAHRDDAKRRQRPRPREFDAVKAGFAGQKPLVELD